MAPAMNNVLLKRTFCGTELLKAFAKTIRGDPINISQKHKASACNTQMLPYQKSTLVSDIQGHSTGLHKQARCFLRNVPTADNSSALL